MRLRCGGIFNDCFIACLLLSLMVKHTHSILMAILPGEPELAGCPINSPSPFIPGLCILLGILKNGQHLANGQKWQEKGVLFFDSRRTLKPAD